MQYLRTEPFKESRERALVTHIFHAGIFRYDEIGVVLVDAVVAQMDARIVQTALVCRVLDGSKPDNEF